MSEYQYVAFRAIDGPVSEKNLAFMRQQSTRAEITPRSFENEYHFGDFRGDAMEMLRRGYDIHLHYANFGTRDLYIRFPHGLPDDKSARPYFDEESLRFVKDKQGRGGILCIEPYYESDDLDELWDIGDILDELVPLRAEILDGDLRPLYLANLAVAIDGNHDPEETNEAPVPAGLANLTAAQKTLANLYGLSDALIAAAAEGAPTLGKKADLQNPHLEWLQSQSQATKDAWLAQWMADSQSPARREMVSIFQESRDVPGWPTVIKGRTIAELQATAKEIHQKAKHKAAEKAARQKAKKRAEMAVDPAPTLLETEKLVKQRSLDAYEKTAKLLAELRESLAGTPKAGLAEKQAQKLRRDNPTLKFLISALRKEGFLPK